MKKDTFTELDVQKVIWKARKERKYIIPVMILTEVYLSRGVIKITLHELKKLFGKCFKTTFDTMKHLEETGVLVRVNAPGKGKRIAEYAIDFPSLVKFFA